MDAPSIGRERVGQQRDFSAPMTPVFHEHIDHPSAWNRKTIVSALDDTPPWTDDELDGFERLLAGNRHRTLDQITRSGFDHPSINRRLLDVRHSLVKGIGVSLLRGIPPDRFDQVGLERIMVGLSTHLGRLARQGENNERLRYLYGAAISAEPTLIRGEAVRMHTDPFEIVAYMCVGKAQLGGAVRLASSLTLHNELLGLRPDLLQHLYTGYFQALPDTGGNMARVTTRPVPVFACVDRRVSCAYSRQSMLVAAKRLNGSVPPAIDEGMDLLDDLAEREDLRATFDLEPGDILVWNNRTHLHALTLPGDVLDESWLMLRSWVTPGSQRPVPTVMTELASATLRRHGQAGDALSEEG